MAAAFSRIVRTWPFSISGWRTTARNCARARNKLSATLGFPNDRKILADTESAGERFLVTEDLVDLYEVDLVSGALPPSSLSVIVKRPGLCRHAGKRALRCTS